MKHTMVTYSVKSGHEEENAGGLPPVSPAGPVRPELSRSTREACL